MKMVVKVAVLATIACTLVMNVCTAAPMNNDDVIKLVKAGMSEALIFSTIDSSEPQFDVSADGIIRLKQAGVSDAVIQRLLTKKSGTAAQPAIGDKGRPCRLARRGDGRQVGVRWPPGRSWRSSVPPAVVTMRCPLLIEPRSSPD